MNDSESFQKATAAAMRFLAHRPRSQGEVRARLLRRFSGPVVDAVIASLTDRGLLDDARFAQLWTESRDTHRPRSSSTIIRELLAKGVDRSVAQEAVREVDDMDGALRAGEKVARRMANSDHATFKRRLWGHLQRRGYSASVAGRAVEQLWQSTCESPGSPRRDVKTP